MSGSNIPALHFLKDELGFIEWLVEFLMFISSSNL